MPPQPVSHGPNLLLFICGLSLTETQRGRDLLAAACSILAVKFSVLRIGRKTLELLSPSSVRQHMKLMFTSPKYFVDTKMEKYLKTITSSVKE